MNDKTKKRCIRGAIFDVDGTLLDSMKIWDNAENAIYKAGAGRTRGFPGSCSP